MESVLTIKVLANVKDLQPNLGTHVTLPEMECRLYHSLYGLKRALEAWLV